MANLWAKGNSANACPANVRQVSVRQINANQPCAHPARAMRQPPAKRGNLPLRHAPAQRVVQVPTGDRIRLPSGIQEPGSLLARLPGGARLDS